MNTTTEDTRFRNDAFREAYNEGYSDGYHISEGQNELRVPDTHGLVTVEEWRHDDAIEGLNNWNRVVRNARRFPLLSRLVEWLAT